MELKDIISVPGTSGLFKVIASNKNGFIVESLVDGKRTSVNSTQRIMSLIEVAVYTTGEELPLHSVFKKIQETDDGKALAAVRDHQEKMRDYFKKIVPDFDQERVYNSDIKKIFGWYEMLKGKVDFSKEPEAIPDAEKTLSGQDSEKPIHRAHESHGPKAEQHAKTTSAKTRKKV